MRLLSRLWRARKAPARFRMIGRVVMDVQLDGCMAHIATINRVGIVVDVKSHEEVFGSKMAGGSRADPYEYLICRTVRPGFSNGDEADEFFRVSSTSTSCATGYRPWRCRSAGCARSATRRGRCCDPSRRSPRPDILHLHD